MVLERPTVFTVLTFHHLGLLTGRPELAARHLKALGYEMGEEVIDPLQEVRLRFGYPQGATIDSAVGPAVELITPLPGNIALGRLLKRRDDYIYHICYEVTDLKSALAVLTVEEMPPAEISVPKPAVLFGGAEVSFYLTAGLGLIELIDLKSGPKPEACFMTNLVNNQ